MSIRPTDLQIIVQKTQEVERLQQSQQQQSRVQQQQFAAELHKQDEIKEKRINSSPQTDEVKINHKEKNASQQQESSKHRQSNKSPEEEKESKPINSEHIIDIKI